jgi:hypothetical protein
VRDLAPSVPAELDALVLQLLAKKPEERFASAGALLQELERLRSVLVHGVGPAAPTPSAAGGRRGPLVAGALVVLLAAAGLLAWWLLGGDDAPPGDAGLPRAEAPPTTPQDEPAAQPEEAPTSDPVDGPTAPTPQPFSDDESALERLEAEAERAWRALPSGLTDAERRDELRRLAGEHAGTTWAARFEAEARTLDERVAASQTAAREAEQAYAEALSRLRAALATDGEPLTLGRALAALAAVELEPGLLADDGFRPRWLEVWRETVRTAEERGQAALRRAEELAAEGRFDEVESTLALARAALSEQGAPELAAEVAEALAAGLEQARATRGELASRLDGLAVVRARFERARVIADRAALAAAYRGPGSLERDLRAFDIEAADARLGALEQGLALPERRAEVAALRADLGRGRAAFESLARAWAEDGWKRRTVNDPRSRGRVHREAVGADARGVLLRVGEQSELVPWSEFSGRPLEVHQLFLERLQRAYDSEELSGIAALMRLSAVLHAVEEAAEMLEPPSGQVFTPEEAAGLTEGFELARPWAEQAGDGAALEREADAASLLATALRAASEERWGETATLLERLLAEDRGTLLVRLISDGRDLPGLPPEPVPEPSVESSPATSPGDERDG